MKEIGIIIISGLSGSGKTTAIKTLEDLGFYCVDNLPVVLLPEFIELCHRSSDDISRIALGIDVRERTFLREYQPTLENIRQGGHRVELVFLECSDEVLIERFSETRRQHPLSEDGSVLEGIRRERQALMQMKTQADRIIDTSDLTVHQLRALFHEYYDDISRGNMAITLMSFGYKYGIPHDIDLLFDVRFLPNPFFVRELKNLSGNDAKVAEYVLNRPEAQAFLEKVRDLMLFQVPLFEREGKKYLTIAIGCTGGRHRSVVIAQFLKNFLAAHRPRVYLMHRDLGRT